MDQQMESPDYPPPLVDASRPSLGFPLGTALLLLVIFSLSGIFSCCYHWDKLRSLRRLPYDDLESKHPNNNKNSAQQSLPVVMPGDEVPRFIALPCPCEPRRWSDKMSVQPPAVLAKTTSLLATSHLFHTTSLYSF